MDHKCRVCLVDYDKDKMYDLFKEGAPPMLTSENNQNAEEDKLKLSEKLEYCCGVRIRESPEMPTKICTKCFDMARIWFNFRKVCVTSQVYLESMCKDREKPVEFADDGEYLQYLMEDLQAFRSNARETHNILTVNVDENVDVIDYEDEFFDDDYNHEANVDVDDHHSSNNSFDEFTVEALKEEEEEEEDEELKHTEDLSNEQHIEPSDEINKEDNENAVKYIKRKRKKLQNKNVTTKNKREYRPPSPSTYMCNICGNVYNKRASFTYHMNMHSDIKKHACEICGKTFRQVSKLKEHIRRHTGEKPYKCSYCDRHFVDHSEKLRHERVHTNTRPYVCNVCGKSFIYSATLKNHLKLHSGEKNYNCLVCQKEFTLPHQLKAHLLTITHKQKEAQLVSNGCKIYER